MYKFRLLTCEKLEIIDNCKEIIKMLEINNTTEITENDINEMVNSLNKINIISNKLHMKLLSKHLRMDH
jgi:hypothetical protein